MTDRRLIETAFPLKQVSLDSVHEKNVRHGHISTLHIWPARRPLAASRATLLATLLRDPENQEERDKLLGRMAGTVEPGSAGGVAGGGERDRKETRGGILHWGRESEAEGAAELDRFRAEIRDAFGGRAPRSSNRCAARGGGRSGRPGTCAGGAGRRGCSNRTPTGGYRPRRSTRSSIRSIWRTRPIPAGSPSRPSRICGRAPFAAAAAGPRFRSYRPAGSARRRKSASGSPWNRGRTAAAWTSASNKRFPTVGATPHRSASTTGRSARAP